MKETKKKKMAGVHKYRFVEKNDLGDRTLAFAIDLIAALSPMMIWNIVLLLVLGSVLNFIVLSVINWIVAILLLITILIYNTKVCQEKHGQTLGMKEFDFQIISRSGKRASNRQIFIRETIGFGLPFIVLMFFTSVFGVIAYYIVNGIVVMIDKNHRSLIDLLTGTCVVKVIAYEKEEVVQPQTNEDVIEMPEQPVETNQIDLHIHSSFSMNGEYNVEEIFQYASKHNLKTISITDINTVKANAIAKHLSSFYGINYVSGIEMSADLQGQTIGILGYFIDPSNNLFTTVENETILAEKHASIERVHLFEKFLKMPIQIDELLENNRFQKVTGDMIAHYVLNHPRYEKTEIVEEYRKGIYVDPYKQLSDDYFAPGKVCYVEAKHPQLIDVLDVIELSGGIAVLANPYELFKNHPDLFETALKMGIQGIEVYRPDYNEEQMIELMKWAKERKLLITCGSDFYRSDDKTRIGECHCPKQAEILIERLISNMK